MIDLHTWPTPNGRKVSIMLEELGVKYKSIPVDISNGEQFSEDFLRIAPNNKIPAIFDRESGVSLMGSSAFEGIGMAFLANFKSWAYPRAGTSFY